MQLTFVLQTSEMIFNEMLFHQKLIGQLDDIAYNVLIDSYAHAIGNDMEAEHAQRIITSIILFYFIR